MRTTAARAVFEKGKTVFFFRQARNGVIINRVGEHEETERQDRSTSEENSRTENQRTRRVRREANVPNDSTLFS